MMRRALNVLGALMVYAGLIGTPLAIIASAGKHDQAFGLCILAGCIIGSAGAMLCEVTE